jgi:outer membrane protein assembly factor BamB
MISSTRWKFGNFDGWRTTVTPARSIATPAVWGDRVVFGGGFGSHEVYAVDGATGSPIWELRLGDDGPTAATVVDGIAFLNTESCTLVAVDIASGQALWERWLGDPLLAQPAVADGRVMMAWPAGGQHWLGAFESRTGKPMWKAPLAADIITAPVVENGRVYVTTFDGAVSCFSAKSGDSLWTRTMHGTSAPWVEAGDVFVARREPDHRAPAPPSDYTQPHASPRRFTRDARENAREGVSRLDSCAGEAIGAYSFKDAPYLMKSHGAARKMAFVEEDAAVGFSHQPAAAKLSFAERLIGESRVSRAWRFQGSRPVVSAGILFETAGDRLDATEIASGRLLWSFSDANGTDGERRLTPPAVANGHVLLGTWDGRLVSLEALTGRVRWAVEVGAPVHWQPVMCSGRVFAGLENGSVVCLQTGDASDDGWPMWGGSPGHNGDKKIDGRRRTRANRMEKHPATDPFRDS